MRFAEYPDTYYMWFDCYLCSDGSENANGYVENDPFKIGFEINKIGDYYILLKKCNYYCVKPTNKYLWCDYRTINYRKCEGDFNKIKTAFEKFIKNLNESCVNDLLNDNIKTEHRALFLKRVIQ